MNKQYCRVGAATPITNGSDSIAVLEYQYNNFISKAGNVKYNNTKLGDFFESKALKIKKTLEELVH